MRHTLQRLAPRWFVVRNAHVSAPPVLLNPRHAMSFMRGPGTNLGWHTHDVVVKDGRVYDAFTGGKGASIDDFKALWEYKDAINFGF